MPVFRFPRRLPKHLSALFLCGLCTSQRAWADNFTWEPGTLSTNWNNAANWAGTPNEFPDDNTDSATIDSANVVPALTSNRTIGALTIRSGADVATGDGVANHVLTVQESLSQNGLTLIENAGSTLTVRQSPAAIDFDTDGLTIQSGATLSLRDGAKVQIDQSAILNAGGQISGNGVLEFNGPNAFANNGTIRASTGGSLVIQSTNGLVFDLDGSNENGVLIGDAESTLIVSGITSGPFDGAMHIYQNGEIQIGTGVQFANTPGTQLNFNGGNGTATLSGGPYTLSSVVHVNSGTAVLAAPTVIGVSADMTIHQGAAIQFDAETYIFNPDAIVNEHGTTLIVNDEVYIGSGSGHFNWDGLGLGGVVQAHTVVNAGGLLNMDVETIDEAGLDEIYSGTITMNSGLIEVRNAAGQWILGNRLELNNVAASSPVVSGDEIVVDGEVEVGGVGSSRIQADSVFNASSAVHVQGGARLSLGFGAGSQTVIRGSAWTGTGAVDLSAGTTTVDAPTTVNMPNGTFDLDGGSPYEQLVLDAPLTLNVGAMDNDGNQNIADAVRIGPAGRLTMNLTNPNGSYEFVDALVLQGQGGGFTSLHLAGSDVKLLGTTSVTGNSVATARVDLGGPMSIAAGGTFQIRGGTAEAPSRVRAGAVISGTGDLVVSSTGPGHLRLDDGANVGVDLVNRGTLSLGPAAASASVAVFTQFGTGTLVLGIDGLAADTQYDQLTVAGIASLSGTLDIELNEQEGTYADPVAPGLFDEFELIMATSINGMFQDFIYGGNPLSLSFSGDGQDRFHVGAGLFRILDYDATELDLLNYRALPGDANGDGLVDGSDFGIWNANKFTAGTDWTSGDFNGDGVTDGSDFSIWNSNKFTQVMLGRPAGSVLQAVPEPAGAGLVLAGLAALAAARRRV